jgi:hypothetical protein
MAPLSVPGMTRDELQADMDVDTKPIWMHCNAYAPTAIALFTRS